MGHKLLIWLMFNYIVISFAYIYQRDYPRALYFISAFGISLAVLWMK